MIKSTEISTVIKYQKKVLNWFAYQWFWLIVFRTGKNYYLQVFAKECKYAVKEKTMPSIILMT